MEELAKVLAEIADYLDVDRIRILKGDTPQTALAKELTCYILEEGFPHLISDFAVMAGMNVNAVYAVSSRTNVRVKTDAELRNTANALRRRVGLQTVKGASVKRNRAVSTTRQLFGFDYTYREEMAYERAVRDAKEFMKKFCKGTQPLEEGFITKRKKQFF